MPCASIPSTGSSFFTASFIVRWHPQSEKAAGALASIVHSALDRDFPADKIHEAVARLVDRRYVLPASPSSAGAVAAYWASLGLSPDDAQKNFPGGCRVRIQWIDVEGATELGAALNQLGVRVVQRSPDLTVTLVSDYLKGRLAELNRQHLSDRTPWLFVQPSGIFPLVGPVLSPGKSACWTCLSDRMRRNRKIKGMLDRSQARCVAVSPLARHTFGQNGIQLAAVEIAKAIATDFAHGIERSHHQPRSAWARPSRSITWRPARNVRVAAARSCATRAARRRRSSLAPAASWS